jgi:hypothetical protein
MARALITFLKKKKVRLEPGLGAAALTRLERALKCAFPAEVRALYRASGGLRDAAWDGEHPPMRQMPPDEVVETHRLLLDMQDTYNPSPDARYIFTDDNSNWPGVFVTGKLRGKITLLDHDNSWPIPHFLGLESFSLAMVDAAKKGRDWTELQRDYPLTGRSAQKEADRAEWAETLEKARTADAGKAIGYVKSALQQIPPKEVKALRSALVDPAAIAPNANLDMVRWAALDVIIRQKRRSLKAEVATMAAEARERNSYGIWLQATRALLICDRKAAEKEIGTKPKNWPAPRSSR